MRAGAQLLTLTPPAASQHITALEKAFGTRLLDRTTRPAQLAHAGARLLGKAQRILDAVSDLETELRRIGQQTLSLLRVGLQASIATTLTPPLIELAQTGFGVEDITLFAGQSGNHEQLLRTKRADLAITSNPFLDMDGLERHHVLTEKYLLVLPTTYHGPTDSLDAIQANLPLVRFGDTTNAGRQIAQHLRRLRFEPQKVILADRSSMVTSCGSAGQGFSLLTPTMLIDGMVDRMALKLLDLPVSGLSRTLTVVARKGELQSLPSAFARMSSEELSKQINAQMGRVAAKSVALAQSPP